jgi:uroporphyrinogen-III decarboxylase
MKFFNKEKVNNREIVDGNKKLRKVTNHGVASALLCCKEKLYAVKRQPHSNYMDYYFEYSPTLEENIKKYHTGELIVPARDFCLYYKALKQIKFDLITNDGKFDIKLIKGEE